MLQLVLGLAGTGKTTHLTELVKARAQQGAHSVFLVPEQFSSSAEALVYRRLGDALSAFVEVASFRTLAERVLKHSGGMALPLLTEAGRSVYVRRALDAMGEGLQMFARQRRSTAFCQLCAQTLAELKTAGATPAQLRAVAAAQDDAKLLEIARIFEAYQAMIAGAAQDPEDRLGLAAQSVDKGYFNGKAVFIDGFDGFTPPEYALLEKVLQHAAGMTVALCCDGRQQAAAQAGLFQPVHHTANHLQRLAGQAGAGTKAPVLLETLWRTASPGLEGVNLALAEMDFRPAGTKGDVFLTPAPDEWQEVALAAAEMRRLALGGVPYSRMAVICRDMEAYGPVVRRQMQLYDIPVFFDETGTIEHTAPVVFIRAALALLRQGLNSRAILRLLKSGLCGAGETELAALENYVYTWSPKAADWRAPFEKNPEGLLKKMDERAAGELALAEGLRARTMDKIEHFIQRNKNINAERLSKNLYYLLDGFGAGPCCEAMARHFEAEGDVDGAQQVRRAWDVAMDLLDQMVALVGGERLSAEVYDELFLLLVRSTDFGRAPQTLECVSFTGADRMRLDALDYAFVLGVNEGVFPMQVGYSGLLNHNDRDALVAGGVQMPGSFENRTLMEEMFFYRALTVAAKGLYVSWPERQGGVPRAMSAALEPVKHLLAPPRLVPDAPWLLSTPAAAYEQLARIYGQDSPQAAALHEVLQAPHPGWDPAALGLLRGVDNAGQFAVGDPAVLRRLLGRQLQVSATVAERYYECRFAYYMERVLKALPRRKADISPLESGTFVHYILEKVIGEAKDDFASQSDAQLAEMAGRHADAFIAEQLVDDTRRNRWRLAQIKQTTLELLLFLRDYAAKSGFTIDALELDIGADGAGVPPLEIEAGGVCLRVSGKVDRVDTWQKEGKTYLCIMDYKTGDKRFSLDEVYNGINMQMIIYMDVLCKNISNQYQNPTPGAILYLTGDPSPKSGARQGAEGPVFKFDGLLLNDGDVLRAMAASGDGMLPVRYNRDGSLRSGSKVADEALFENLQQHAEKMLAAMAGNVMGGHFPAQPLVRHGQRPCAYCPYRAACRHEDGVNEREMQPRPENAFADADAPGEGGAHRG